MSPLDRRWGLDVFASVLGVVVLVCGVAVLVEGVEHARALGDGAWVFAGRLLRALPGHVAAALPVAAALGAARVAVAWRHAGHIDAVFALGVSPGRLVAGAAIAGALAGFLVLGAREVAAEVWSPGVPVGRWVTVPAGEAELYLRLGERAGPAGYDVRVAWVEGGRLSAVGRVAHASWGRGEWAVDGAEVRAWDVSPATVLAMTALPPLEAWAAASDPGPDDPVRRLLSAPPNPATAAWTADRAITALASAVWAGLGVAGAERARRRPVVTVLVLAGAWRLVQVGAIAASASGAWSLPVAVLVPIAMLVAIAVWSSQRWTR